MRKYRPLKPRTTRFACPCCGDIGLSAPSYELIRVPMLVRSLKPPYQPALGAASHEVCRCCGFEFGNDDDPGTAPGISFEDYLAEWIAQGCHWFQPHHQPADWLLEKQLSGMFILTTARTSTREK